MIHIAFILLISDPTVVHIIVSIVWFIGYLAFCLPNGNLVVIVVYNNIVLLKLKVLICVVLILLLPWIIFISYIYMKYSALPMFSKCLVFLLIQCRLAFCSIAYYNLLFFEVHTA